MIDLKNYCEYLYNFVYIPIYIYENSTLLSCYPAQSTDTIPPNVYLNRLWESDKVVTYTLTHFCSYYGCVRIGDNDHSIVIGPVNDIPYSSKSLQNIRKEFLVDQTKEEDFSNFFHVIPTQNLDIFLNMLLFINNTLNHTQLTKKDVSDYSEVFSDTAVNTRYSEEAYISKEDGILNNNYAIESELLRYVETGNLKGLKDFNNRAKNTKVGIIANDNLRQLKNIFVVNVSIVLRAAIKGGLSPSIAYRLSDIYLQQVERLTDLQSIISLNIQVQYDFTNRVANSITPILEDNILNTALQYVRENTNKRLTVSEVADYVGFSRPHLSRKVKHELGFNLSDFILRCKLEESKDLLTFSTKSISEISSYLCFSNQSHFQRVFKQQYDVTPQIYRKTTVQNVTKQNY